MSLDELMGGPGYSVRESLSRGRISRPPASAADSMMVVLDGYSSEFDYEVLPGNWTPVGVSLPATGAACLVVLDNEGEAYVPVWAGVTPLGSGSSAPQYHHAQMMPSSSWVIVHNLGRFPNAKVVDSTGRLVFGDVQYNSANQITLTFSAGFSGDAYLD